MQIKESGQCVLLVHFYSLHSNDLQIVNNFVDKFRRNIENVVYAKLANTIISIWHKPGNIQLNPI